MGTSYFDKIRRFKCLIWYGDMIIYKCNRQFKKVRNNNQGRKKYDFFGVKSWFFIWNTPKISRLPPLGAIFLSAPPLTWNPGSAPDNGWRLIRVKCLHHVVYLIMFWSAVFFDLYYHDIIINVITPSRPTCQQGQVKTRTYIRMESLEK